MTENSHLQASLPDFRNLGVMLRILVIAELTNLGSLVAHAPDGFLILLDVANLGFIFEAVVLAAVLVLFVLSPWLAQLPYRYGVWLVVAVVSAVSAAFDVGMRALIGAAELDSAVKAAVLGALLAALILVYFNWRHRVLSPALADARLMALQSRIRPHFLFNSLNTAVSLLRQDVGLAERVLLDMADLFRVLLADSRSLVPLADEIRLAKSYLEIEQSRLGERLRVVWDGGAAPPAAQVPILVLQPLLENAVRYGVEPASGGGEISIAIAVHGRQLVIEVRNPVLDAAAPVPGGNRIALANIAERLALHFDAEGTLRTFHRGKQFVVRVSLPLIEPAVAREAGGEVRCEVRCEVGRRPD